MQSSDTSSPPVSHQGPHSRRRPWHIVRRGRKRHLSSSSISSNKAPEPASDASKHPPPSFPVRRSQQVAWQPANDSPSKDWDSAAQFKLQSLPMPPRDDGSVSVQNTEIGTVSSAAVTLPALPMMGTGITVTHTVTVTPRHQDDEDDEGALRAHRRLQPLNDAHSMSLSSLHRGDGTTDSLASEQHLVYDDTSHGTSGLFRGNSSQQQHSQSRAQSVTSDKRNHPSRAATQPPSTQVKVEHPAAHIQLKDLERVEKLGKGYYGDVHLVRHASSRLFALKVIERSRFPSKHDQRAIANEIVVMRSLGEHPLHTRLLNAYRSPHHVYLLLDYAPNGMLAQHITPGVGLNDFRLPRFHAACTLLAIRHMHRMNICHRDLKPGNLLISSDDYIQVCDYGFARVLPAGERTTSLAGTLAYNAPEQFLQKPYDHSVDLWALGVCVYEMLFGQRPFDFSTIHSQPAAAAAARLEHTEDSQARRQERREKRRREGLRAAQIMHGGVRIPESHANDPGCTPESVDFVRSLLEFFWVRRLGNKPAGGVSTPVDFDAVMSHAFFDGIDWDALESKTAPLPRISTNDIDDDEQERAFMESL